MKFKIVKIVDKVSDNVFKCEYYKKISFSKQKLHVQQKRHSLVFDYNNTSNIGDKILVYIKKKSKLISLIKKQ